MITEFEREMVWFGFWTHRLWYITTKPRHETKIAIVKDIKMLIHLILNPENSFATSFEHRGALVEPFILKPVLWEIA